MRITWKTALFILLFVLFVYVSFTAKPVLPIRLAGSTAFQPFAEKLAEKYMSEFPGITVDVQGGGSAVGVMASQQGIVDIGMADLLSLPHDIDYLERTVVARDGIAVIVNPANKANEITFDQLGKIFSGEIDNWQDVSFHSGSIRVISREEGSGTKKSFDQLVLKGKKLTREAMFQDSNGTIREAVRSDPNAIGYISIGYLTSNVKPLLIDGIAATNENVKAGTFKISRPIFLILKANPSEAARKFFNYLLETEAQKIIASDGLIPVK